MCDVMLVRLQKANFYSVFLNERNIVLLNYLLNDKATSTVAFMLVFLVDAIFLDCSSLQLLLTSPHRSFPYMALFVLTEGFKYRSELLKLNSALQGYLAGTLFQLLERYTFT